MGYRRKQRVHDLDFSGTEDEGLHVRMRGGLSVDEFLRITGVTEPSADDEQWMISLFASRLESWNLENEDGSPVPVSEQDVRQEDFFFIRRIIDRWTEAIGSVSDPLPESSPAGEPSPAAQIPMAPLSPSHEPWPTPNGSSSSAVPSTFSPASS